MNKVHVKMAALLAAGLLCGCAAAPIETTTVPPTTAATVPATELTTEPNMETYPEETFPEETLPIEIFPVETFPQVEAPEAGSISYEEYLELDADVQQAYYENFASGDEFFIWLEEAQAAYEASESTTPDEELGMEEGVEDWE